MVYVMIEGKKKYGKKEIDEKIEKKYEFNLVKVC
jgi:hypothetical protein